MNVEDLQTFHGDLRAAVRAGVKLEIGEQPTPGSTLSIKKLEQLEKQIASGEEVPARYRAAIETWQQTGTMVPILEGLSARIIAWRQIGGLFRKAMTYVLIVVGLGIAGLIYFQLRVLPQIELIRQDLASIARRSVEIPPSSVGLLSKIALVLFVIIFIVLLYWLFSAGSGKIGWWIGGGNYMRCKSLATATRTTQMLVAEGTDPQQAATLGGQLAGLDQAGQGEIIFTMKGLDRNAILSPAWADYLLMIADRQYLKARTWGPAILIVTAGGVVTFLYVLIAYWPIVSLLYDLNLRVRA